RAGRGAGPPRPAGGRPGPTADHRGGHQMDPRRHPDGTRRRHAPALPGRQPRPPELQPGAGPRAAAGLLSRGDQPLLHVAGDATLATVLDAMESLAPADAWRRLRPRIEHGEGLAADLVPRTAALGIVLV